MTLNTNSWSGYYDSSLTLPLNQIMEMYGKQSAASAMIVGWWTSAVGGEQGGATAGEWAIGATTSGEVTTNGNQGGSFTAGTYYIQSIYSTSSAQTLYVNYVSTVTETFSASASYPYIGGTGSGTVFNIYWLRTRAYPPSGVMPTVSFGSVQSASSVSLSISPNPATYGQSVTITATCTPNTDSCAIDYPALGTAIATGTGSATYTYSAYSLAAGTYSSFYANDITAGTTSAAQTLTVNKNSTYTFTLTSCGAQVYPYSCNTVGTVATHANQLTASLYLNNNLLGSTNTVISNTISNSIGYYYYTFNTLGNANYTANSLTANFSSYVPINIYYANTISSEIHKTLNTSGLYLFNPPPPPSEPG